MLVGDTATHDATCRGIICWIPVFFQGPSPTWAGTNDVFSQSQHQDPLGSSQAFLTRCVFAYLNYMQVLARTNPSICGFCK